MPLRAGSDRLVAVDWTGWWANEAVAEGEGSGVAVAAAVRAQVRCFPTCRRRQRWGSSLKQELARPLRGKVRPAPDRQRNARGMERSGRRSARSPTVNARALASNQGAQGVGQRTERAAARTAGADVSSPRSSARGLHGRGCRAGRCRERSRRFPHGCLRAPGSAAGRAARRRPRGHSPVLPRRQARPSRLPTALSSRQPQGCAAPCFPSAAGPTNGQSKHRRIGPLTRSPGRGNEAPPHGRSALVVPRASASAEERARARPQEVGADRVVSSALLLGLHSSASGSRPSV